MTTVVPTTLDQAYLSNFASSCNGYYSSNNPNSNFYGVGNMHNNSVNGLFFEEVESQNSEVRHEEQRSSSKHEEQSLVFEGWRSSKGKKRKACAIGQWSTDEDSRLKSLVEKHGERKWAFIAEKMVGRAGKQCRERWINHLRDNIKKIEEFNRKWKGEFSNIEIMKDAWDEEEERMLVEAHEQFGN
ncbi:transcription factor MYB118-like [Chenopodium quinoa]|uniref:transcription factor MYB118-like n=1 Tax=Chenopodium quinoa TaxID=63459 RepID=UPI000B77DE3E|nr:transcription factor MYB118-like [Chenopodium quinoa]